MSELRDVLPLTAVTYQILLALADRDRHGYGVIKEIERRTEGAMSIETGTLYHALKRMKDDRTIELVPAIDRSADEDQRRRAYRLTDWGRDNLDF